MKLQRLVLSNFRGFSSLDISFDPSFTVLLGENMAGKSALLHGAAFALRQFLQGTKVAAEIEGDDVHQIVTHIGGVPDLQRQFPVTIEAHGAELVTRNEGATWLISREAAHARTQASGELFNSYSPSDLPAIVQYGTQRHWDKHLVDDDLRGIGTRYDGYTGWFDSRSTHSALVAWMRKQTLVQLQRGGGYVQPQLRGVESAVRSCIEGVARLWYDVQYDELRLERATGDIQSFSMLSEGVRNMVAMVADIAWRCAVLNPQHGSKAHLHTDGVVLIDELDLHLHPAWQRRVVDDLKRTFPKIQFIVTTHSPQIVSSVSRSQIRLLDRNRLVADKPFVEGRDANEILEDVFGVSARPAAIQVEIDAMYRFIEDGNFPAARERLASLEQRLGPDDAAMIRAKWIIDTEEALPSPERSALP